METRVARVCLEYLVHVIFVDMMKLIILVISLLLYACIGGDMRTKDFFKPGGRFLSYKPKGGSEAYNQGWIDGCESGLSIFGHVFQKSFYAFKKDQRFYGMKFGDNRDLFNGKPITEKDEAEYQTAWSSTYSWCRHSMLGIQQGGRGMSPHLPGDDDILKLHGLDQIYELQSWGNTSNTSGWFSEW